jgi:tetratricopeptide (TPR) repeat protein
MVGEYLYTPDEDEGASLHPGRAGRRMRQGFGGLGVVPAAPQPYNRAYLLDLLGDSHSGLGCHDVAIEAYRQAAEGFRDAGAQCSHALCLLKIADSYLSLDEPWHAIGYLEACLPLLRDLGLSRHEVHAQHQLVTCQAALAEARLPGEGRVGQRPEGPPPSRPAS